MPRLAGKAEADRSAGRDGRSPLLWGLWILFVVQLLMTVYFNLFQMEGHMGYDSSWSYLKARLMWDEKSLVSDAWVDQTNVFFDSPVPLAALLYGITGNLLLSYGMANCAVLSGILILMDGIMKKSGTDAAARLFALNMVICPYLTNGYDLANDIGYFTNLISGPGFYSVRALVCLLVMYCWLGIRETERFFILEYVSFALCFVCGMSSGIFILVMILLPYFMYEAEQVLIADGWKPARTAESVYLCLCGISVVAGKAVASSVFHIEAIDSSRTWCSIERIWTNAGAVVQGLMKLLEVLPVTRTDMAILSMGGIVYAFPLFVFFAVLLGARHAASSIKEGKASGGPVLFMCNAVACNFLMFCLFNVQYGTAVFEERYLVSTYLFLTMLTGHFISGMEGDGLAKKALCAGLLLALAGDDFVSDRNYLATANDTGLMEEVKDTVGAEAGDVVYVWGDDLTIFGRCMRVYDPTKVYKCVSDEGVYHHWGDYTYFDDNASYNGATCLIVREEGDSVPEDILEQYVKIRVAGGMVIYFSEGNTIVISR